MKKLGKAIILVLTCILSFSVTACGSVAPEDGPIIVRDRLEATELKIIFASEGGPADAQAVENKINSELANDGKPYRVDFEFIQFVNYMTNVESKAKAGYDAAWVHIDNVPDMLQKGVIKKNIKPYLDVWGQKLYEEVPEYAFTQVTGKDGGIYAVPRHAPMANDREILMVRKDWMDTLGIDSMTTLDEFNRYLAGTQSMNASKGGFAAHLGENSFLLRQFAPNFYFPYYENQRRPIYININDGSFTVKSFYNTQNFLDMCAQAYSYKRAGYLPTSSVTNVEQQFNSGLTAGVIEYSVLKMTERIDAFKSVNRTGELYDFFIGQTQEKYLNEVTEETENKNNLVEIPKVVFRGVDNMMVSLAYSKHTEEFIDFMCWTKDQDNYDLVNYGVKGENFYLTQDDPATADVDEGGRITFIDPETGSIVPDDKQFLIKMPYWAFNDIDYMRYSEDLSAEYVASIKNWEGKKPDGTPNYKVSPLIGFNIENTPAFLTAKAKVSTADAIVESLIGGTRDVEEEQSDGRTLYQKLLADLNANNAMNELIAEVQRQLDAYLAK